MSKAQRFISYVLLMYRRGKSIQSENTLVFPREWDRAWDGWGQGLARQAELGQEPTVNGYGDFFFPPRVMGYSRTRLKQ